MILSSQATVKSSCHLLFCAAWIDASKRDKLDGEIAIVGYEIPFNRHFYKYVPPRSLKEIDADLDKVSSEIMELLREVHS